MSKDTANITLGTGSLFLNNVEVGHLKGDVEFVYTREKIDFKPSGSTTAQDQWVIAETAELRASIAEFKLSNLRLAMGIGDANSSFTGSPSYNPASFTGDSDKVYDSLTFGGGLTPIDMTVALRFEHIKAKTAKKVVIILYSAVTMSDLTLAFHEEDFNLTNIVFRGKEDLDRPAGDRIGMVIEQETA